MQRNSRIHWFALFFIMITVGVFSIPANAEKKYTRKSISRINTGNQVLLLSGGQQFPREEIPYLIKEVSRQVEMARFDYNQLPEGWHQRFWAKLPGYLGDSIKRNIPAEMRRIDQEIDQLERRAIELSNRIIATRDRGADYRQYEREQQQCRSRQKELEAQKRLLLNQRQSQAGASFDRAAELLTQEAAPTLVKVLSDPEVLEERAALLVDEIERQKFIVRKANTLGITAEDLEWVMNSAYLYMIFLTDLKVEGTKTNISGGIAWFKLDLSRNLPNIKVLKVIETEGQGAIRFKLTGPGLGNREVSPLHTAIKVFAQNLKLKTQEIPDFMLGGPIVEGSGRRAGFPLGTQERVHIDQRFRVYQNYKRGDEIKERKVGFLYVTQIADNASNRDNLSYDKVIMGRAERGMHIREYPATGFDFNLRFRSGSLKLNPGTLEGAPYRLNVNSAVTTPIYTLNGAFRYNFGQHLQVSQLFITLGGSIGLTSFGEREVTISPAEGLEPKPIYYAAQAGLLKKFYLRRLAFLVEPRVEFDNLWLRRTNQDFTKVSFTQRVLSFTANAGVELALMENINIGFSVGARLAEIGAPKWSVSGTQLISSDDMPELLGFSFPKVFMGVYLNYTIPKFGKLTSVLM